jgi:outer membrane protein OmpA-like peptidoglycan-associated protein
VNTRTAAVAILLALAGALGVACGPKRVSSTPGPTTTETLVVLLQDPDTRATGRASLFNPSGSADLEADRDSAIATPSHRPGPVTRMSDQELQRVFGAVLAALPPAPVHFTLYFRFESNELTDQSRALVPEILNMVKKRAVPEVSVIGHTDTMGTSRANIDLGLNRATTVRNLLVSAGLDASTVEITSHGESNLLIPTPDETPEPRNRRVEISVR